MTTIISKKCIEKMGKGFFSKLRSSDNIKSPQVGKDENIFLSAGSGPVIGKITFSEKSEMSSIVQYSNNKVVPKDNDLSEFMSPAFQKFSEVLALIPTSSNVITEIAIYLSMFNAVLNKLSVENPKGKLFANYDEDNNEAHFEWAMNDRRFGIVSDNNSESSWFLVKSNGQSDSGSLIDLSQRQMEKIIRELLA